MPRYTLELDILSGGVNPLLEIKAVEFDSILKSISKLETIKSNSLFEGLGFRGFVLRCDNLKVFYIQKDKVKVVVAGDELTFKKSTLELLTQVFELLESSDVENNYEKLISLAKKEYGVEG